MRNGQFVGPDPEKEAPDPTIDVSGPEKQNMFSNMLGLITFHSFSPERR